MIRVKTISECLHETIDELDKKFCEADLLKLGACSPFEDFNKLNGIFNNGELYLFAGPTGSCKSTFLINIIDNIIVRQKLRVLFFNLQNSYSSVVNMLLSSLGQIEMKIISSGFLMDDHWSRLTSAIEVLSVSNLFLCRHVKKKKIEKAIKKYQPQVVIFDSIDQLVGTKWGPSTVNLNSLIESYAVANVCYVLKRLAGKYNIPILASHTVFLGDIIEYQRIEAKKIPGPILSNVDNFYYMQSEDNYNSKINICSIKLSNGASGRIGLSRYSSYMFHYKEDE